MDLFVAIDDPPKLHQLEYLEHHSLIIKTIDRVAAEWKRVALHLHFEDHCIKVIEMNCHYQPVSACRSMFSQWLEGKGREPRTWRTLIVVLEEANLHTIAQKLRNLFPAEFSVAGSNQTQSVQHSSPQAAGILLVSCDITCMREGLGIILLIKKHVHCVII